MDEGGNGRKETGRERVEERRKRNEGNRVA